jgi:hypothetical protein
MTRKQKEAWVRRHGDVERAQDISFEKVRDLVVVGQTLPVITYKGQPLTVKKIIGNTLYVTATLDSTPVTLTLKYDALLRELQQKLKVTESVFPTAYSATDHEEHFCEAIALLARKRLGGGHEEPLREVMRSAAGKGLWHNIRKKRRRGKRPARPGESDYPDAKTWDKLTKKSKN